MCDADADVGTSAQRCVPNNDSRQRAKSVFASARRTRFRAREERVFERAKSAFWRREQCVANIVSRRLPPLPAPVAKESTIEHTGFTRSD
jgi:hypothetical protein